jgi:hypothetical protein
MQIVNYSTKNNVFFSIKKDNFHIGFDSVAEGSVAGTISFWSSGVFTGLIEGDDVKEATQLMIDNGIVITNEADKVGV